MNNSHKWTCYVSLINTPNYGVSDFIKKVIFKLHPTYRINVFESRSAPFELTRHGHSPFTVKLTVYFHDYLKIPPLELNHLLDFSGPRVVWDKEFEVHRANLKKPMHGPKKGMKGREPK